MEGGPTTQNPDNPALAQVGVERETEVKTRSEIQNQNKINLTTGYKLKVKIRSEYWSRPTKKMRSSQKRGDRRKPYGP